MGEAPRQREVRWALEWLRAQARGLMARTCLSLPAPRLEGKRFLELGKEEDFHPELESLDGDLDPGLPSTEDVILKTEQVTKNIQELLRAAQEFKHDRYGAGHQLSGLWVLQRARGASVPLSLATFPRAP